MVQSSKVSPASRQQRAISRTSSGVKSFRLILRIFSFAFSIVGIESRHPASTISFASSTENGFGAM